MPEPEAATRDRLALRRTTLANERTLLAYLRTALMLVASGVTLWRLQPLGATDRWLGAAAIAAGVAVVAWGAWRFAQQRAELAQEDAPDPRA
ncbi:DUF202 domain-containing protein [Botrimarina sp.]|uniref:DUF202 domain-containing protein n=1 Tax=Botrimarina sp. TaxID=2795802 RepID=UPI0032EAC623